jgi:1-acyl-sn-glycerol-3-phosphate acyltransferase
MRLDMDDTGEGPRAAGLENSRAAGGADPGASAKAAEIAGGYLRLWFALVLCGILFLGGCAYAVVIRPFLSKDEGRRVARSVMQRMFQGYLRVVAALGIVEVDSAGLASLGEEASLILAPNHPSMLDAMLVIARLGNVGCIMKANLWDNVFLGAGARLAGFIRNDSPYDMVRLAVEDLRRGSRLLIFPEATRTVRRPVNRLSGGFALIAKKSRAPVQTILIETDSPYLRKGWPLYRRPPMPIRFRLRLGRRFEPRDDTGAMVAELERYYLDELGAPDADRPVASGAEAR